MPGSVRENDADVIAFVADNGIKRVLDVGAGGGTYSDLLRGYVEQIDAVEIWRPYIDEFKITDKYSNVYEIDARDMSSADFNGYDLIIFGDVMEHMSEQDSLTVWRESGRMAAWGLISVPIIHYPQGAEFGNPYEVHVQEHLHPERVRELFGPFDYEWVYSITGTFVRRFGG